MSSFDTRKHAQEKEHGPHLPRTILPSSETQGLSVTMLIFCDVSQIKSQRAFIIVTRQWIQGTLCMEKMSSWIKSADTESESKPIKHFTKSPLISKEQKDNILYGRYTEGGHRTTSASMK